MKISHSELIKILRYDEEIGLFIWKEKIAKAIKIGNIAGHISPIGYVSIKLYGKAYLAHRLAWFYMTSEWPKDQIDHINTNKTDNRWSNLREATKSQNSHNKGFNIRNKTGFKGVIKSRGRFTTYICLGTFNTAEEAAEAYKQAALKLHGEFAHHSLTSLSKVA